MKADAVTIAPYLPVSTCARRQTQAARLFDALPDACLSFDRSARLIDWNAAAEMLLGSALTDGAPDMAVINAAAASALDSAALVEQEQQLALDGRWYELRAVPDAAGVFVILRDIDDRRRAEQAQRDEASFFRTLIEHADAVVSIVDVAGQPLYDSPSVASVFGWSVDELRSMNVYDLAHPDDVDKVRANIQRIIDEGGTSAPLLCRVRHQDGNWHYHESIWTNLLDNPAVGGIMVITRDVTERQRSAALYRAVVEHIPSATYMTAIHEDDPIAEPGRMSYMSPQISAMLGYSPDEWLAQPNLWIERLHPDDRDWVLNANRTANEQQSTLAADYRLLARDGSVVWLRDVSVMVRDDNGQPSSWLGFLLDITEQRDAEERLCAAERQYRALIEHIPAVTYIEYANQIGNPFISPQMEQLTGYPPEAYYEDRLLWRSSVHPDDIQRVSAEIARTDATGDPYALEYRMGRADGGYVWIYNASMLQRDEAGQPLFWQGFIFNITDRKAAEQRQYEAERDFRTLVEQTPAVIYRTPPRGLVGLLYISPRVYDLLGICQQDCYADPRGWYVNSLHPDDRDWVLDLDQQAGANGTGTGYQAEYRLITHDDRVVWVRDEAALVHDEAGEPVFWQGVMVDITERKALEEQLQYRAFHDALTGLPNRALLLDRLNQALALHERTRQPLALLFLDLDNFKIINDSLGHTEGDALLQAAAARLLRCVRGADTVARFGGDEFAVLLSGAGGSDPARVARRIQRAFKQPFPINGRELTVTTSIGIAYAEADLHAADDLLRRADVAMYRAKGQGKNSYEIFDAAMHASALRRLELEDELRVAIDEQQIVVHFQPKISLATGAIVGVEALARWQHPTRGLIPPSEFIGLAEESGLIVPLGLSVLHQAARQVHQWRTEHPGLARLALSVNLSARQFQLPDLVERVVEVIEATGIDPTGLTMEITESVLMDDAEESIGRLYGLKALGVAIAIDDFGTGYSSLAYLKRFPIDILKIDRSFINGLGVSQEDTAIVSAIVSMARSLSLLTVAEGVETAAQVAHLTTLGCDIAQGFHYACPLPAEGALCVLLGDG